MIGRHDTAWPFDAVDDAEQRHDMACAGFGNGVVQTSERADVNHSNESRIAALI